MEVVYLKRYEKQIERGEPPTHCSVDNTLEHHITVYTGGTVDPTHSFNNILSPKSFVCTSAGLKLFGLVCCIA